jgi:hypothetical protein
MNKRDRRISAALDWCIDMLDKLNALPPDKAQAGGLDMVRGWKRSLEAALDKRSVR